jgi:hypothetical protein
MRWKDASAPGSAPPLTGARPTAVDAPAPPSPAPRPSATTSLPTQTAPAGTAWHPLAKPQALAPGSGTLLALRAQQQAAAASQGASPTSGVAALDAAAPPDGVAYLEATLTEIRRLRREQPGIRPIVVFDLDNTIFETRARTLAALQAIDAAQGTKHFQGLALEDVGKDGRDAALRAGLSPEAAEQVQKAWLDWFWQGSHFMEDHVFTKVEALVHEASRAGAEVVYLTGRVNQAATLDQLRAAGLPDADVDHVMCKPAVGANTGAFKGEWLRAKLEDPGVFLGWFMTEGRRDIASVQAHDARIPCVRLGYVHEREGHAVAPTTPLVPESWTHSLRPLPR